eukprot:6105662-Amphidinium_carterae.2
MPALQNPISSSDVCSSALLTAIDAQRCFERIPTLQIAATPAIQESNVFAHTVVGTQYHPAKTLASDQQHNFVCLKYVPPSHPRFLHERALQVHRPRPRCSSTKQDERHDLHQSFGGRALRRSQLHTPAGTKAIGRKQFEASSTVPLALYPGR